jgi:hypothetical protein
MIGDAAIGKVVDGLTDAVDSVTRVAGKAVRDKDMAERNQNAELIALWEQYRAEFGNANKGGFDAFVDGMNRLVRPVTAFSVLGSGHSISLCRPSHQHSRYYPYGQDIRA